MVFGVIVPGVVTIGQLFLFVLIFPLWASMFPINAPVLLSGVGYWALLITQGKATMAAMLEAGTDEAEAEDEAEGGE